MIEARTLCVARLFFPPSNAFPSLASPGSPCDRKQKAWINTDLDARSISAGSRRHIALPKDKSSRKIHVVTRFDIYPRPKPPLLPLALCFLLVSRISLHCLCATARFCNTGVSCICCCVCSHRFTRRAPPCRTPRHLLLTRKHKAPLRTTTSRRTRTVTPSAQAESHTSTAATHTHIHT